MINEEYKPDSIVGFKCITDDGETASCAERALHHVIVHLAVHISVELIMLVIREWHLAAGTREAILVPMPGAILAIVVNAFVNWL